MTRDRIDLAAIRARVDDPFAPVSAPDLAALCDEVERMREIIAGRATPPTEAEIEAHHKAGGFWMYRGTGRFPVVRELSRFEARIIAEAIRTEAAEVSEGSRWWTLGPDHAPCAWPVVTEVSQ